LNNLKKSNKKNIINIKFLIYYILLIEYLNKKIVKGVTKIIYKHRVVKKELSNSILYSPNRHKIAQKHFKISQYKLSIPFLIELSSIKFNFNIYVYIIKFIKILLNINVTNLNLDSIYVSSKLIFNPKVLI
jgi:hypothetical protein